MSRPLRVFLCHASQDKPAVRELYKKLAAEPWIQPWLDEEELYPGQDWNMEIEKAVEAADAIIVCLSKGSITKDGYVQREIRTALDYADYKPEGTLYIIPVRLEECEPPRRLRAWQYADYFEGQRGRAFQRLLVSLKRRADALDLIVEELERKPKEENQELVLKKLESQAVQFELSGKLWDALKIYYQIKKIDPVFPRIDIKISQLEKEIRPRPILTEQLKTHVQRKPALKIDFRLLGTGGVILLLLIIGGFGLNYLINNLPVATAAIPSPTNIATLKPSTSTIIPFTSTPQPTKTLMPTPTLEVRSTEISPKDGMALLYVPAGDFLMGSTDADSHSGDEKPQHTVYLGAFWVDRTEVNNKMYSLCVNAGVCSEPANIGSFTRSNYFGNSQFDDYPVIYVDWNMAKDYCEWAGRRLPTEAEWEKAARGTEGWVYPWGGYDPNEYFLNYDRNVGDTSIGGDMSSIYGVYNMVGNVWEWVSSLYEPYPYSAFDGRENLSGSSGPRVIRGGSWNSDKFDVRTANREWQSPLITSSSIGFRCVRSP